MAEHLIHTPNQVVTHLVLKAGEKTPKHKVDFSVIVVPIKGLVLFTDENDNGEEIYPGRIVQMTPGKVHGLEGIEDSELMVIKSALKAE